MSAQKYTISLKVSEANYVHTTPEDLEYYLNDLLVSSVLPALDLKLVPLTLTVKKARN
jgi:hypothetical protein